MGAKTCLLSHWMGPEPLCDLKLTVGCCLVFYHRVLWTVIAVSVGLTYLQSPQYFHLNNSRVCSVCVAVFTGIYLEYPNLIRYSYTGNMLIWSSYSDTNM